MTHLKPHHLQADENGCGGGGGGGGGDGGYCLSSPSVLPGAPPPPVSAQPREEVAGEEGADPHQSSAKALSTAEAT